MPDNASVVYLIADKLGGIMSMNSNLIRYRPRNALLQCVVLVHNKMSQDARFARDVSADSQLTFEYSSFENLYAVVGRLHARLPKGSGTLVTNSQLELSMLEVYDPGKMVVHIVHDSYNLRLALMYEAVIDAFISHSRFFYERLLAELPVRRDTIFYLPYGVPIPNEVHQLAPGPLRLVFVGRLSQGKGIFDLPVIDRYLADAGVPVSWTVIGDGPQKQRLLDAWGKSEHVRYVSPETNAEVLTLCAQGDVFVLPTRFEGFPVSLLEAMSTGLVPVVSDLPSGIPEVVNTETGYRLPPGDCVAFANAIGDLDRDRARLEAMSHACRQIVVDNFDIRERVPAYHQLFSRYDELRRPRPQGLKMQTGNRLDQPWIPNWLVQTVRRFRQARQNASR